MNPTSRRDIPSVDRLLAALAPTAIPRPLVVDHVRRFLAEIRQNNSSVVPDFDSLVARIDDDLRALSRTRLQPVINATGILAHTNLGRAPLGSDAVSTLLAIARGYSNLELDLESGDRGRRGAYLETALAHLCQAEAATVVNNCAAALVLILRHFAKPPRLEVVISRGELIQIGGGFRIPDILESSGARLREVGTTNRTTIDDYARALGPQTALVLKVHRSNFHMEGFVESPTTQELATLTREHGVPFVEDLGSGALVDIARLAAVDSEPRPQESLEKGADLVCFSGDKLLGGPQAGLIVGRQPLIEALRRDPFFRALRCDKLVFAALQSTLESYLRTGDRPDPRSAPEVPMLALLREPVSNLEPRALALVKQLAGLPVDARTGTGNAQIGGGVCPRSSIPSVTVRLRPERCSVDELARRLRTATPPILGFIADGCLQLDLRTVFPDQDPQLLATLHHALNH
jgi:L-seryl-tRNA(Ser) seleniumtransferase